MDHFTYVMLMSGESENAIVNRAFEHGVDDFVSKGALRTHLLPRVWAACRTAGYNNTLLAHNRELREQIASLERRNMIDSLTGLGNQRFTDRALSDILRQVASRGGAACLLMIHLSDFEALSELRRSPQTQTGLSKLLPPASNRACARWTWLRGRGRTCWPCSCIRSPQNTAAQSASGGSTRNWGPSRWRP